MARPSARRRTAPAQIHKAIELASDECFVQGSHHVRGCRARRSPPWTSLKKMAEDGTSCDMRIWMMLRDLQRPAWRRISTATSTIGAGNDIFTVRAIKRQIDGALGSRGAWLLEPYTDKPDCSGAQHRRSRRHPPNRRTGHRSTAIQLCVHAIGDRANRETLNIYEEASRPIPIRRTCAGAWSTRST